MSYRAAYDLACFDSERERVARTLGQPGSYRQVLGDLAIAFRLAPRKGRARLVRWAEIDPSLEAARAAEETKGDFEELLRQYRHV